MLWNNNSRLFIYGLWKIKVCFDRIRNYFLDDIGIFIYCEVSYYGHIGIKFQRENKSIPEAITLLKKASSTKSLTRLIVVKTHGSDLIEYEPSDVIILDSLEYTLSRIIKE